MLYVQWSKSMAVRSIEKFLNFAKGNHGFYKVLNQMRVVSASKGKCHCELEVTDDHVNSKGTLHGGLTATLVDTVSALAVATTQTAPGFTTDLNITYMRPAKKGDTISIAAECLKIGKTMAFVSVDILSKSDGNKLVAQGRQAAKLQ